MAEGQPARATVRYWAAALLTLTLAFGLDSMFGQVYRHGWMDVVSDILGSSNTNAFLPLTERLTLKRYTGWAGFDKLLALANIMFVNVVDGSTPQLSLYAFQFAGQLVPVFAIIMIEGMRSGNRNNVFYYSVVWGYLMQMTGYATTMPIYCLMHLFVSIAAMNSPEAVRPHYLEPLDLRAMIPAFTIGYGFLTFLFAYPFSSNYLRQWLCAVWQGFPHYVVGIQCTVEYFLSPQVTITKPVASRSLRHDYRALSRAYDFVFCAAAATQMLTITVICIAKVALGLLPVSQGTEKLLTFRQVFVPGPFHSTQPLTSMATEMHNFYLYDQYVGSVALLIWTTTLCIISCPSNTFQTRKNIARFGLEICCWALYSGPAGAAIRILQKRDEALLCRESSSNMAQHASSS